MDTFNSLFTSYSRDPAAFLAAHSHPFLLLLTEGAGDEQGAKIETSGGSSFDIVTATDFPAFALMKRHGGAFEEMITVGRASNNDVVISQPGISKMHAIFRKGSPEGPDRWTITDMGSRNGTKIGERRLDPRQPVTLGPDTPVAFGRVACRFVTPAVLGAIFEAMPQTAAVRDGLAGDGPLVLGDVAARVRQVGPRVLTDLYKECPVLAVKPTRLGSQALLLDTPPQGIPLPSGKTRNFEKTMLTENTGWTGVPDRTALIVPVLKSQRNPFSGIITIGRALNNDIRFTSSNVSNVHARLRKGEGGVWQVADQSSTNGTRINGIQLEANKETALRSGDELQVADVTALFLDVQSLGSLCALVDRQD